MEKEIRLRFAPSPTGFLHIGGLRTALYNYLYAKQKNGKFLLRIEDTDRTRFVEGAIENLANSLKWSGIEVDEGMCLNDNGEVYQKGEYGPYIQSERVSEGIYNVYIDKLLEEKSAYYCFCTKERLDNLRKQQELDGKLSRYDGLCRGISLEEAKVRIEKDEEHVVRLWMPDNKMIHYKDGVKGDINVNSNDVDDQVLIKSDGFPTYHFAVVVDDHLMKITHIARGDEWVSSLPKHIYLYEVLGWEAPEFIHLPVILNKDHKKLSKRNDDVSVSDFIDAGYLPEGLINYLALVGWSPDDNQEIFTMDELIERFSFDRVSTAGGIFDKDKLNWVNAQHIKLKSNEELVKLIKPYLIEANYINAETEKNYNLELLAATYKDAMHTLKDIIALSEMIFVEYPSISEEALEIIKSSETAILLDAFKNELANVDVIDEEFAKSIMKKIQKETGIKGKNLFMPVRSSLCGSVHGPDLSSVFILLGKEKILNRIEKIQKEVL